MWGWMQRIPTCAGGASPTCMAPGSRAPMPEQTMTAAEPRRVPWWAWLFVSAAVIGLDQLSKWLVQKALVLGESIRVLPFFDVVLVYNPGAAFSFLSSASGWQRHLFTAIA